jgi:hypothetical protein
MVDREGITAELFGGLFSPWDRDFIFYLCLSCAVYSSPNMLLPMERIRQLLFVKFHLACLFCFFCLYYRLHFFSQGLSSDSPSLALLSTSI